MLLLLLLLIICITTLCHRQTTWCDVVRKIEIQRRSHVYRTLSVVLLTSIRFPFLPSFLWQKQREKQPQQQKELEEDGEGDPVEKKDRRFTISKRDRIPRRRISLPRVNRSIITKDCDNDAPSSLLLPLSTFILFLLDQDFASSVSSLSAKKLPSYHPLQPPFQHRCCSCSTRRINMKRHRILNCCSRLALDS